MTLGTSAHGIQSLNNTESYTLHGLFITAWSTAIWYLHHVDFWEHTQTHKASLLIIITAVTISLINMYQTKHRHDAKPVR